MDVKQPFEEWWTFITENFAEYFFGIFRINVMSFLAVIAIVIAAIAIILGLAFAAGATAMDLGSYALPALVLLALVLFIAVVLVVWIAEAIKLTAYVYTDCMLTKKKFGIIETFNRIKWNAAKYVLLDFAIIIAIMIPGIILALIAAFTGIVGAAITFIYILVAIVGYMILSQFWVFGFLVKKQGVVDALKESVNMVKKNLKAVILFDLGLLVGGLIFEIPSLLYSAVSDSILENAILGSTVMAVVIVFLHMVITLALATLGEIFTLPTTYLMWKKLSK